MNASPLRMLRPVLKCQVPSFIAVGLFGFLTDSAVTIISVRAFGMDPFFARLPAFALATLLNFGLNRAFTFRDSRVPLARAFVKYLMVCAVGFCVNYVAYFVALKTAFALGFDVPTALLPLFVAWGAGWAMLVTFFGYQRFAFKL